MIHLEKINAKNVWGIIELNVAEEQEDFVAPNSISIVEAYTGIGTGATAFPFGIYDDEEPVGFLMIVYNINAFYEAIDREPLAVLDNSYNLCRLMIDEKHQRQGYGREAMKLALEFMCTWPCGKAESCTLSYEAENSGARSFYASLGFAETGDMDGDEIVAVLKL